MTFCRYYRLQQDLTQQDLADKVGISQPKISEIENGNCRVSHETLIKIGEALNFMFDSSRLSEEFK